MSVIRAAFGPQPTCSQCGAKPKPGAIPRELILGPSGIPIIGSRTEFSWECVNGHTNIGHIIGRLDGET